MSTPKRRETYQEIVAREQAVKNNPDLRTSERAMALSHLQQEKEKLVNPVNIKPIGDAGSTVQHNPDGTSDYNIVEKVEQVPDDVFAQTSYNIDLILRAAKQFEAFVPNEAYFTKVEFDLIKRINSLVKILISDMLLREHMSLKDMLQE